MKLIVLTYLNVSKYDDTHYILNDDFVFKLNDNETTIPKHTKTDFATIPYPISLVLKRDYYKFRVPSLIHDYCYTTPNKIINKSKADLLFKQMLINEGVNVVIANMFYFAVYLFGKGHWKTNGKP